MAHVKKGDTVLVIAGKDKGVKGTVLSVLKDADKVIVEGVNRVKRHTKVTTGARGAAVGGIQIQEAPIHISNVKLAKEEKKAAKKASSKVKEEVSQETESAPEEKKPAAKKAAAKKAPAKKATKTEKA